MIKPNVKLHFAVEFENEPYCCDRVAVWSLPILADQTALHYRRYFIDGLCWCSCSLEELLHVMYCGVIPADV